MGWDVKLVYGTLDLLFSVSLAFERTDGVGRNGVLYSAFCGFFLFFSSRIFFLFRGRFLHLQFSFFPFGPIK